MNTELKPTEPTPKLPQWQLGSIAESSLIIEK